MTEFTAALDQATAKINARRRRNLAGPRPIVTTAKLHVPTATLPNPGYRPRPPPWSPRAARRSRRPRRSSTTGWRRAAGAPAPTTRAGTSPGGGS
ncbi:hypothetical protein NKH77_32595 [Streptomyces sp. M19]